MVSFNDFYNEWIGRRVGDDSLVASGEESNETKYQCVSLIKQYMIEIKGLKVDWPGNAIDFWYHTAPAILNGFTKHNDGSVQQGDIVVLHTLGHNDATEPGHIGVATGNGDPNSVEVMEQNGIGSGTGLGSDAVRTRYIPRNRIAGVLRPIPDTPAGPPYKVLETFSERIIEAKHDTHKYDISFPDFNAVAGHMLGDFAAGAHAGVTMRIHHNDGYEYYLASPTDPGGYNVADWQVYTPPPPPKAPPAAPVPLPHTETYQLLTTVMTFDNALDARTRSNAKGPLDAGTYIVWLRDNKAVNLTRDNMKPGVWINDTDNRLPAPVEPAVTPTLPVDPPPAPAAEPVDVSNNSAEAADWRITARLRSDGKPVLYDAINTAPVVIRDLELKHPAITMQPYNADKSGHAQAVPLVSTFTKDGVTYGRTKKVADNYWYYGIPLEYLRERHENLVANLEDDGENFLRFIETAQSRFKTLITDITPQRTQAVQKRAVQFIDGFKRGNKR